MLMLPEVCFDSLAILFQNLRSQPGVTPPAPSPPSPHLPGRPAGASLGGPGVVVKNGEALLGFGGQTQER